MFAGDSSRPKSPAPPQTLRAHISTSRNTHRPIPGVTAREIRALLRRVEFSPSTFVPAGVIVGGLSVSTALTYLDELLDNDSGHVRPTRGEVLLRLGEILSDTYFTDENLDVYEPPPRQVKRRASDKEEEGPDDELQLFERVHAEDAPVPPATGTDPTRQRRRLVPTTVAVDERAEPRLPRLLAVASRQLRLVDLPDPPHERFQLALARYITRLRAMEAVQMARVARNRVHGVTVPQQITDNPSEFTELADLCWSATQWQRVSLGLEPRAPSGIETQSLPSRLEYRQMMHTYIVYFNVVVEEQ